MKKSLFLILLINIMMIGSCCTDTYTIVGTGDLQAFELENRFEITEVIGSFILISYFDLEVAYQEFQNPFSNELYGTSCDVSLTNPIDDVGILLTCNKSFEYDGSTIEAGTNLIEIETVIMDNFNDHISVLFTTRFTDRADFTDMDNYEFTLEFETSDGLTNSTSISLDMQI